MDVLYYIGSGSSHNNDELRLSLRSLDKYCVDVDRVWVVGNKPAFLRNVEYLWVEDSGEFWQNAFNKTKAAIEAGISDEFLLMNDDFFMLAPFEAKEYPYYHRGDIPLSDDSKYQRFISDTGEYLKSLGLPFKHYGVHCPIRIEGKKYLELEKHLDKPRSIRCLYGNMYAKGVKITDCKGDEIKPHRTKCFSSLAHINEKIYQELIKRFPEPSRWEDENL